MVYIGTCIAWDEYYLNLILVVSGPFAMIQMDCLYRIRGVQEPTL